MLQCLLKIILVVTFGGVRGKNLIKIMKGERKRRISAFKRGNIPHNKGIKCRKTESQEESDNKSTVYIRPTDTEMDLATSNPVLSAEMSPESVAETGVQTCKTLRPRPHSPLEVEKKNSGYCKSR